VQLVGPSGASSLSLGLGGALRAAQTEYPGLLGQTIEVQDAVGAGELIGQLTDGARTPQVQQIRYLAGQRQVRHWEAVSDVAPRPARGEDSEDRLAFKDQGVYVITGGLGGLGLMLARQIARHCRDAVVVLLGRSALDEGKQALLAELRQQGLDAQYRAIDVTQGEALRELARELMRVHGRVNGVLHLAGVLRDGLLRTKSRQQQQEVFAPKVQGTVNLDLAFADARLDFLALFSSVASVVGNVGQTDYAAANAFMDTYAAHRQSLFIAGKRHGRTVSINWPLWLEGGMRADAGTLGRLNAAGMQGLDSQTGWALLNEALMLGDQQMVVVTGDAGKLNERPVVAKRAGPSAGAGAGVAGATADTVARVESAVLRLVAALLKADPDTISPEVGLDQYGLDSINLASLSQQLNERHGLSLTPTIFFEFATVRALATKLAADHPQAFGVPESGAASAPAFDQRAPLRVSPVGDQRLPRRRTRQVVQLARAAQAGHAVQREPIAIIGISGRYPESPDVQALWDNIAARRDLTRVIDRWDVSGLYEQGELDCRRGGFRDDIDQFDARFFNIPGVEAEYMDPQQRLFLQECWRALEDAGHVGAAIGDQRCGVYVGYNGGDYTHLFPAQPIAQSFWGNAPSVVASRISYHLNLKGPAMAVDTACSSSLVAIHLACQGLWSGEAEMALAGGGFGQGTHKGQLAT